MKRLLLTILLLGSAGYAHAQTLTNLWNGTTGAWSDPARWDIPPVSSNETVLVLGGSGTYRATNDLSSAPFVLNQLIVTATALVTNTGTALEFRASDTSTGPALLHNAANNSNFVLLNAITNLSATLTVGGTSSGTINLNGPIAGTGGLVKAGTNTAVLGAANSFSGGITISNGTLSMVNGGAGSGPITLSGGTLSLSFGSGSGFSAADLLTNNLIVTTNSTIFGRSGSDQNNRFTNLTIGANVLTINAARTDSTFRFLGTVTASNSTFSVNTTGGDAGLYGLELDGPVLAPEGFTKTGGGSMRLMRANAGLAGTVTVGGGTLGLSAADALGAAIVLGNNGAWLNLLAANAYTNSDLTVATNGLSLAYSVTGASGSRTIAYEHGNLILAATGAVLTGGVNVRGTVTFAVSNAYAGPLSFSSGTLNISANCGYSGTSAFTVPTNGILITTVNGGQPFGTGQVGVSGTLQVNAGGSLVGVTNFVLLPGSTLALIDNAATDLWEDERTLALNNATFRIQGQNLAETLGNLEFSGADILSHNIQGGTTRYALTINTNFVRVGRATLLISRAGDVSLGTNTTSGAMRIVLIGLNADPASANTNGMLRLHDAPAPYIIDSYANSFLRYVADPNGGTGLVAVTFSANSLSNAAPTDIISVGGTQNLTNNTAVWALRTTVNNTTHGSAPGGPYTLTIGSGGLIMQNSSTLAFNIHFGNAEGVVYITGNSTLTGNVTGNKGLTKFGGATLIFAGLSNNLSGPLTVNSGTVSFGNTAGLGGTNNVTINRGAVLNLSTLTASAAAGVIIGGLNGEGLVTNNTANSLRSLTLAGNSNNVFNGVLAGSLSLVKDGTGLQVLNGTNTYTGSTTLNSGTLSVNGLLAGSAVTVNGTLAGNGTLQSSVLVNGTGTLAPGESPGALVFNSNLTLASGATLELELLGDAPGTEYDQVIVGGAAAFAFSGATLAITALDASLATGTVFVVVHRLNAADNNADTFANAAVWGGIYDLGAGSFQVQKLALDGDGVPNDIALMLIPEPSALNLVGAGLLLLLAVRRRPCTAHRR